MSASTLPLWIMPIAGIVILIAALIILRNMDAHKRHHLPPGE